jgi:hypothetical protein
MSKEVHSREMNYGIRNYLSNFIGAETMRKLQITIFILGAASLIVSAIGIGPHYGETLYKTGIALLLLDIVCIQLWPSEKRS